MPLAGEQKLALCPAPRGWWQRIGCCSVVNSTPVSRRRWPSIAATPGISGTWPSSATGPVGRAPATNEQGAQLTARGRAFPLGVVPTHSYSRATFCASRYRSDGDLVENRL
jgi:hypothetical protein